MVGGEGGPLPGLPDGSRLVGVVVYLILTSHGCESRLPAKPSAISIKMFLFIALAPWLGRLECCPVHQRLAGSIPSQGP